MKLLSASFLLALSIYFLALPQWIMQVFGATLCSIGFIIFASITLNDKRNPQLITQTESIEEFESYRNHRAEVDELYNQDWEGTESSEYVDSYRN